MAHRHKAHGGATKKEVDYGNKDVIHEAEKKKTGGAVAKKKDGGKVVGRASGGRLDKRARGGGVGADKHPFSSAFKKSDQRVHSGK
jgi:hypothetical protein